MSKTVAIIGSYAPSLLNFRGSLIKAMIGRGHRVVCMAPEIEAETADRLAALGAEVRPVDMQRAGLNPVQDLRTYRSLRKALSEISPDVVIPYTIKPVVWGVLAAHSAGVARIVPLITGLGFAFTGGVELLPPRQPGGGIGSLSNGALARAHRAVPEPGRPGAVSQQSGS